MVFIIADQINHGDISDPQLRLDVSELNFRAASKTMRSSNYVAAYFYSNAAIRYLPPDHWETQYVLSLSVFMVYANAAYIYSRTAEATR